MRWYTRLRRPVQVLVLALVIAIPLLTLAGVTALTGSLCAGGTDSVVVSCALGALQITAASRELHWSLLLSALPWIVVAVVLGRVFCSWICPQGLLSEGTDAVRTRVRPQAPRVPDSRSRRSVGRFVLLGVLGAVIVGSLVLRVPVFCYICPVGLLCRSAVGATALGTVGAEVIIVGLILVAELFLARRGWCKYICPIGALYGLCRTPASLHVERQPTACLSCHRCETDCPMGNSPLQEDVAATCTNCGICVSNCPGEALSWRLGRSPRRGRITTFDV